MGRVVGVGNALGEPDTAIAERAVSPLVFGSLIKFETNTNPPSVSSTSPIKIVVACLVIALRFTGKNCTNVIEG